MKYPLRLVCLLPGLLLSLTAISQVGPSPSTLADMEAMAREMKEAYADERVAEEEILNNPGKGIFLFQVSSSSPQLYYWDGQTHQPLLTGIGRFSGAYPIFEGSFPLFDKTTDEAGNEIYELAADIKLPAGSDNALVVFQSLKNDPDAWRVYDYSLRGQGPNTARFINASSVAMGIKMGGQTELVPPWGEKTVKLGSRERHASLMIAVRDKGKPKVLYQNRIQIIDGMRALFVGYPHVQDDQVRYRVNHRRDLPAR